MSDYIKVGFNLKPYNSDAADLMAAFLADIGFESFEHTDDGLCAYVQDQLYNEALIEDIIKDFPFDLTIKYQKELIPHEDWNEEWEKKYFQPIVIGNGRCVVHSTFHKDYPAAEYEIIVDPKMAFGTGHHATTTMMANFLFDIDVRNKKVLDMGTGTGILAMIAYKLGASEIIGIEIDPDACENARDNARLNETDINFITGDADCLQGIKDVDIFLANINRNIILADLGRYVKTLHSGSILLLSGFYISDIPIIENALRIHGLKIEEVKEMGENWASLKARYINY